MRRRNSPVLVRRECSLVAKLPCRAAELAGLELVVIGLPMASHPPSWLKLKLSNAAGVRRKSRSQQGTKKKFISRRYSINEMGCYPVQRHANANANAKRRGEEIK